MCWVPKVDGDVSFPKKMPWRTQAYGNLFYRAVDALIEVAAGCYGRREGSATRSATVSAPMQGARTGMRTGHDRRRAAFTSCVCCCCEVAQSCPTLCNPTDCSLPGSSVHGILQGRIVEQVPFPSPGDLPDPGIEPASPALAGEFFTTEPPEMLSFKDCKARLPFSCVLAQYLMQHGGSLI